MENTYFYKTEENALFDEKIEKMKNEITLLEQEHRVRMLEVEVKGHKILELKQRLQEQPSLRNLAEVNFNKEVKIRIQEKLNETNDEELKQKLKERLNDIITSYFG